ncbi:MAG: Rrf2 family transcriptional regulator [Clostridiales bacterium]|jgi:DNA-binding IscR family transcriptional regulator|nr:Rrf2 family transcriptional regulator [Clostridiales bacterium]
MRISTKTSIALHLLVLLEVFKDQKLTSEILAMSTGCNPVIVRNMIGGLKKAGLVNVQRGSGGASLAVAPDNITVWDVYQAVDLIPLNELIGMHPNPSIKCPVGSKIYDLLEKPYGVITDAVKSAMSGCTLKQILNDYYGG